jgi:hypothetical protein
VGIISHKQEGVAGNTSTQRDNNHLMLGKRPDTEVYLLHGSLYMKVQTTGQALMAHTCNPHNSED